MDDPTTGLFAQLLVSAGMVLITVAFHGMALALLSRAIIGEWREERSHHLAPLSLRGTAFTLAAVMTLFLIHGAEIWGYAALFFQLGAHASFEGALYYSTISYAAIGYDDAGIDPRWRMVGAIEGINGVLLLGWSTAFFINLLRRLRP